MNVGAVIISFNPNLNQLLNNINSLVNQVEEVVVVDNASKNVFEIEKKLPSNIKIIIEPKNVGIAKATNDGIRYLKSRNFEWVVTLDQDSTIPSNYINEMMNINLEDKVGMIAPIIYNDSLAAIQTGHQHDNLPAKLEDGQYIYKDNYQKALHIIASGAIVNTNAWKAVDGMDDFLFIDRVDFDFNMKLLLNGYLIIQRNITLKHNLGYPVQKIFLSKTFYSLNHSSFRKYYIYRNSVIMSFRYGNALKEYRSLIKQLLVSLLIEEKKIPKLLSTVKGIIDGTWYSIKH